MIIDHVPDQGIPSHIQAELAPPPLAQQPAQPQSQQPTTNPAPAQQPAQQAAPANLFQLAQQHQQQQQQNPSGFGGGGFPPPSSAQLDNIRQLLERNPEMAGTLIQQIVGSDPALSRHLAENPQLIAGILGSATAGDLGEDDEEGPVPPGTRVLSVTPEERAAIERVCILCLQ